MKRLAVACLLVLPASVPALADDECYGGAMDQHSINQCAIKDAAAADARMNTVYRALIAARKGDKAGTEVARKAQRAWLAFRDADIDANFPAENKMLEYGSMYPQCRAMAVEAVTRFRTAQLCRQIDAPAAACKDVDMNPKIPDIGC